MLRLSRAALFAACVGLAAPVAIVAAPAVAQEITAADVKLDISIPSVVAVNSSMSEDQIKAVFSADFLAQAERLATLNAASITIPEISVTFNVPGVEDVYPDSATTVIYRDLVLSDVTNGKAAKVTIAGGETSSQGETTTYKAFSVDNFDIRLLLGLVGIVKGDATAAMSPVYTAGTSEGGGISGPVYSCTYGAGTASQLEARPVKVQIADVIAIIQEHIDEDDPPPEALSVIVSYVTDLLRAVRGGASSIGAVDCQVPGDLPISIKVDGASTGDFEPAIYPEIKLNGFAVDAGPLGVGSLGELAFKTIDLNPTLDALDSAAGQLSDEWFDANWRYIIPSFGGFSLDDLMVDAINPDNPEGARLEAKLDSFDLSLGNYITGIPTDISASAVGIEVPLPQDTTEPGIQMLLAAGLSKINMGFDVAAHWDEAQSVITLEKLALAAADLGGLSISASLGNATEALFAVDPNVQMNASMGITVKQVIIQASDDGVGAIAWPIAAAQEGSTDVEAFRTQMAGFAEGLALQMLGSTDAARQLGAALGDFVTGRKGAVTITITAKDTNGIPLPLFIAAQDDPSILMGMVDVVGSSS